VHSAVNGGETEAELRERPLWVDENHGATGIEDIIGEVPSQNGALAAALTSDERMAELAVLGRDRDRPAFVVQ
jgi:hypothetical protein